VGGVRCELALNGEALLQARFERPPKWRPRLARAPFPSALPTVDAFETPLGRVPVDHNALNEIAGLAFVSRNDAVRGGVTDDKRQQ